MERACGRGRLFSCGIEGFSGERLPGTTDNDGSVTLTYTERLGTGHTLIYTINDNYRGSSVNNLVSVANNAIPPITLGGSPSSMAVLVRLYQTIFG